MNESKLQKSGLKLILCYVFRELYDGDVFFHHSLDQGTFGTFITNKKLTNFFILSTPIIFNFFIQNR